MAIETQRYIRKPLYVDAVRITNANFEEIATWCQGDIVLPGVVDDGFRGDKKYIKVRVHNPKNPRQTKAFVGDWLLYTERGYKVYTNKAFHASFDLFREQMSDPRLTGDPVADAQTEETIVPGTAAAILEAAEEPSVTVPTTPEETPIAPPPTPKIVPPAEPPHGNTGQNQHKRVLSQQEQTQLGPDKVREMLQAGDVVLEQDAA